MHRCQKPLLAGRARIYLDRFFFYQLSG